MYCLLFYATYIQKCIIILILLVSNLNCSDLLIKRCVIISIYPVGVVKTAQGNELRRTTEKENCKQTLYELWTIIRYVQSRNE